jgi:hypothetical protein
MVQPYLGTHKKLALVEKKTKRKEGEGMCEKDGKSTCTFEKSGCDGGGRVCVEVG